MNQPTTGPDGLTRTEREALPPAERNRKWRAAMDAVAGRVVADCDRLDARDYDGNLLEADTGDRGDRQAIAEYGQAVRRDNLERYEEAEFQAGVAHNQAVDEAVDAWARANLPAEYTENDLDGDADPAQDRVRLFRQRILGGMTVEQAKAADVADETGRWGSGVYGCGYGDDGSETLEEVFGRLLGDGWWEQVVAEAVERQGGNFGDALDAAYGKDWPEQVSAEAKARDKRAGTTQCGSKGRSPRYDSDGNEYVEHTLYDGLWQKVTAYGAVGTYKLNEEFDLVEVADWELEAIESLRNQ